MSASPALQPDQPVVFPNGNQAAVLHVPPKTPALAIWEALGIPATAAVIILCGSTTALQSNRLNRIKELLSRGVARAALETGGLIIDGGTQAGVIELMGQGVLDRGRKTPLVGVVPAGKVTLTGSPPAEGPQPAAKLDPNHSHFVLVAGDHWGAETQTLFELAQEAATGGKPVLTVLAGGNPDGIALDEALAAVRHGWPLLIIEGSGRLADKIASLVRQKTAASQRKGRFWSLLKRLPGLGGLAALKIDDPHFSEIVRDGKLIIFPRTQDADHLHKLVKSLTAPPPTQREDLLHMAWKRFAEYDLNSLRHRDNWHKLKNLPLWLSVLSTTLVLIYSAKDVQIIAEGQDVLWVTAYNGFMDWMGGSIQANPIFAVLFRFLIILLPISTSIILGIETRFKLGSKYLLLRGAAEAVKRGIYSYRALSSVEAPADQLPNTDKLLSKHLEKVSKILLESDVNEAAFKPYTGSIPPSMWGAEAYDDGRSTLTPDLYIRIRIGDQLKFFSTRTNQYEKRLRNLQVWILVIGGLGTFMAAIGAQYWLPLTAAIVSGITAFLEYRQIEPILVKYNMTKSSLENIHSWWEALSAADKRKDENIFSLVREVEAILESENQGWVQYVKQAQETQKMTVSAEEVPAAPPEG